MKSLMQILSLLVVLLISKCGNGIQTSEKVMNSEIEKEELVYRNLLNIEKKLRNTIDSALKNGEESFYNMLDVLTDECGLSILQFFADFKQLRVWPFKMLDASGFIESSIIKGTSTFLGSYQQCINIENPVDGKYCQFVLRPPLPPRPPVLSMEKSVFSKINATFETDFMKKFASTLFIAYDFGLKMALCLPATCVKNDVSEIAKLLANATGSHVSVLRCEEKDDYKMDNTQKYIIAALLVIVTFNVIGSVTDEINLNFFKKENTKNVSTWLKFARMFSIRRNTRHMMKTTPAKKENSLDVVNGMRYFSATWVYIGHGYSVQVWHMIRDVADMKDTIRDYAFQVILSGHFDVVTFAVITAILTSYIVAKSMERRKNAMLLPLLIVKRVLRMVTASLLTVGLMILIPTVASDGPVKYDSAVEAADNCRKNWWHLIVFVSNWLDGRKECAGHLWYISMDMQLLLLAVIYFVLLIKSAKLANVYLVVMTLASVLTTGLVRYIFELAPTLLSSDLDIKHKWDYFTLIYSKPYPYIGAYCVGLFLGTFLTRRPSLQIPPKLAILGWLSATVISLTLIYSVQPWQADYRNFSTFDVLAYGSLAKVSWGLCMAWVAFACFYRRGGWINDFLSWPGFVPLVRISQDLYFLNFPILFYYNAQRQGIYDTTHMAVVFKTLGSLGVGHVLSVIVYVTFTSPFAQMQNALLANVITASAQKEKFTEAKEIRAKGDDTKREVRKK